MSRAVCTTALAFACSVATPVYAQTSPGSPQEVTPSEPCYEAETPILLGSFLEPRATADVREISDVVIEARPAPNGAEPPAPPVEIPQNRE